jgi:hypothetical protein
MTISEYIMARYGAANTGSYHCLESGGGEVWTEGGGRTAEGGELASRWSGPGAQTAPGVGSQAALLWLRT